MKLSKTKAKQLLDKYTIAGLWLTMCGYIVLLFFKELITGNYLISFSVDVLVAILAFYIAVHNYINQYRLLKENKFSYKPFKFQVFGFVVGLFIAVITAKSPFDISFLILVIAFITNKKMLEKEIL